MDDDGRLAIGKFPSVHDERSVTKGEVLALRLATLAGIDAAEARLVSSEGVAVAIIGEVEAAVSTWRSEARSLGLKSDEIVQFAAAFEHAERTAARKAARSLSGRRSTMSGRDPRRKR